MPGKSPNGTPPSMRTCTELHAGDGGHRRHELGEPRVERVRRWCPTTKRSPRSTVATVPCCDTDRTGVAPEMYVRIWVFLSAAVGPARSPWRAAWTPSPGTGDEDVLLPLDEGDLRRRGGGCRPRRGRWRSTMHAARARQGWVTDTSRHDEGRAMLRRHTPRRHPPTVDPAAQASSRSRIFSTTLAPARRGGHPERLLDVGAAQLRPPHPVRVVEVDLPADHRHLVRPVGGDERLRLRRRRRLAQERDVEGLRVGVRERAARRGRR